mgnify:CR=1 FL=1
MSNDKFESKKSESSLNRSSNHQLTGSRWYCLFFGYHTQVSELDMQKLAHACSRFIRSTVVGDKRVFFEVDLSRSAINLGSLQFKIQSFSETWDLPHQLWQWGVGKTLAESWVQTRWKSLVPEFLPIESLDDFMHPLSSPVGSSANVGLGTSTFNVLRCLGYETLADLGEMPHDLLLVRLSQILAEHQIHAGLADPNGLLHENWMAEITAQSFCEVDDREPIEAYGQPSLFCEIRYGRANAHSAEFVEAA